MPGEFQPLVNNQRIVNPEGLPTEYFIRWAQQKQIDIEGAITAEQCVDIIVAYLADHTLQEGSGITLSPSGNISDSPTVAADVQAILDQITDVQGSILFRGAADWEALAPGTAGQFLKTNGVAADPAWAAGGGGGGGYTLLDEFTTVGGETSITFASISTSYDHLMINYNAGNITNNNVISDVLRLQFNGDTTAGNYAYTVLGTYGAGSGFGNPNGITIINSSGTSGVPFGTGVIDIVDYQSAFNKTMIGRCSCVQGNIGVVQGTGSGWWKNNAAITDILLKLNSGVAFKVGSHFSLYGI